MKFRHFLFILTSSFLLSCTAKTYTETTVKVQTVFGDIIIELYPDKAPESVRAFLEHVEAGNYRNSNFYRVVKAEDLPSNVDKTELIQGGINYSNPALIKQQEKVTLETTAATGLLHNAGTVSLARSTERSSASEFFICLNRAPAFDFGGNANQDKQGYAAFGKVVKGMDVVRKIHAQPATNASLNPRINIKNIIVLAHARPSS